MKPRNIDPHHLLWTLAALAVTTLPHLPQLPGWAGALMLITVLWRLGAQYGRFPLPGVVWRMVMALGGFAAVFLTFRTVNGLEAGSTLLVVMAALKLTETRSPRDLVVVLLITIFLILTLFLFGQTMLTASYAIPALWIVLAALLQVSSRAAPLTPRAALGHTGVLMAQALPLMLVMFLLFPRIPGPFWAVPRAAEAGMTGVDDQMSPGSISNLLQSDAVAFRVTFEGAVPPPQQRYWRGPVLSNFNGRRWWAFPARNYVPGTAGPATAERVRYEVTLQPHQRNWLFTLEQADPATLPRRTRMTSDRRVLRTRPVTQLTRYRVESWPQYWADRQTERWSLQRDLELRADTNPRAAELARSWADEASDPAQVVERALAMFREQPFVYTLTPPALSSANTVDEFIFGTRRGFCEHFASSFTFMMRAAGIPARVVVGYQGGETNPYGSHLTVRQSDAHAWSEVWLTGRGWRRVDPTAAVAPDRVELGLSNSIPAGESLPGLWRSLAALEKLRLGWDAGTFAWNEWFLGYGRDRQRALLRWLGMEKPTLRKILLSLIITLAALTALVAAWVGWQTRVPAPDRLSRIYRRFCRRLASVAERRPAEAPLDYAERISAIRPDLREKVYGITRLYLGMRYLPGGERRPVSDLRRQVARLRA